jgi:hypothetical protein
LYEIGGFLRHVQGHPTQLVGGRDRSLVVGVIRLEPRCVIGGAGLVLGMLSVGVCGLSWCCVVFSVVQWNERTRNQKNKIVSSNELQGPCKHQKLRMDGTLTLNTRTATTHKQPCSSCQNHITTEIAPTHKHQRHLQQHRRTCTDGRMRYNHERLLWSRGAVKAVPESCSAYKPYGQRCGLFWPNGNAPFNASELMVLPNPEM